MYALGHWESCQINDIRIYINAGKMLCFLSHLTQVVYSPSFSYSVVKNMSRMNKWVVTQIKWGEIMNVK